MKRGFYLGSRVVSYGFTAYLSRASIFSFLLSSVTQTTSPCATESKAVAPLKMVMQGLQTTVWLDCAYRVNQFSHGQKTIVPSWPKVVCPVADGKDVASCGLSIGLLLASFFQD